MPLLDVHSIAAVRTFRMELVTIINYEAWDTAPGSPPELPVVNFTGGRANHSLDGITLLNAGNIAGKPGEIRLRNERTLTLSLLYCPFLSSNFARPQVANLNAHAYL